MLTLPEELYLLALDERTGHLRGRQIDRGLCGAVLADLVLRGKIRVTPATVRVQDASPIAGELLLNDALSRLAATSELFSPEEWMAKLHAAFPAIRRTVGIDLESKLAAGVHHFGKRARHVVAESSRQELIDEIHAALTGGSAPTQRTLMRASLLRACSLLDLAIGPTEMRDGAERATTLARDDPNRLRDLAGKRRDARHTQDAQVPIRLDGFVFCLPHIPDSSGHLSLVEMRQGFRLIRPVAAAAPFAAALVRALAAPSLPQAPPLLRA